MMVWEAVSLLGASHTHFFLIRECFICWDGSPSRIPVDAIYGKAISVVSNLFYAISELSALLLVSCLKLDVILYAIVLYIYACTSSAVIGVTLWASLALLTPTFSANRRKFLRPSLFEKDESLINPTKRGFTSPTVISHISISQ